MNPLSEYQVLNFIKEVEDSLEKRKIHPVHALCIDLVRHFGYLPEEQLNLLVKQRKIKWGNTLNYKFFKVINS